MNASLPITFAISDLQTGYAIIARIPLSNALQAEVDLNRFLDSLLAAPPDGDTYFQLLEQARPSIAVVAGELARRYLNKALPLSELEEGIFQGIVALWLKTARAYAHCAEHDTPDQNDAGHPQRVAMILHRCIHHTGMAIVEHQRVRREYPWGLWLNLHGYYGSAEEWGVAALAIPDALESTGRTTDCSAAYISFLLCDMASCYSLSVFQQTLVRRWSVAWSPLVSLHLAEAGGSTPQYFVDLMQDVALRPVATAHLRRLDTSRLATHIIRTRELLSQKTPPNELELGVDCTAGQCKRLLDHLAPPWSQARSPRKFRRHDTSGSTELCTGFEDIHYFISGKEFEQPDNVHTYSRQEFESLFTFRHQDDPRQVLQIRQKQQAYAVDTWQVVNESANGFRLVRSSSGKQMAHGQLLALRPHDGERFFLAHSTWLMQEKSGGLIAGIKALPGMPVGTAARPIDETGLAREKYQRAFLLPAVPSVCATQSLVIPQGWFKYGRVIELFTDGNWRVRLLHMLEDGADFARVSFEVC